MGEKVEQKREQALGRDFATFLRLASVYPASNARVGRALESLRRHLDWYFNQSVAVEMRFQGPRLVVGGCPVEETEGAVAWLRLHFQHTKLGGITIENSVTDELLFDFCTALRENQEKSLVGGSFSSLWGEWHSGILPDRIQVQESGGEGGPEAAGEPLRSPVVVETLAAVESGRLGIARHLRDLQERCGVQVESGELLARVLDYLPPEQVDDPDDAIHLLSDVVQVAEQTLLALQPCAGERDEEILEKVMMAAAVRILSRDAGAEGAAGKGRERTREGLSRASTSMEMVLRDWEKIPGEEDIDLDRGASHEALGAHLQILLDPAGQQHLEVLGDYLSRHLEGHDQKSMELFNAFSALFSAGNQEREDKLGGETVYDLFNRAGIGELVSRVNLLSPTALKTSFPLNFAHYLDKLDPRNGEDVKEFNELVRAIGSRRIAEEEETLAGEDGIVIRARAVRILTMRGRDLFPLIRIILKRAGREYAREAALFMARSGLRLKEAAPFRVCETTRNLPLTYLLQLCEAEIAGRAPQALTRLTAVIIRNYIESLRDQPAKTRQRAAAIRSLVHFPTMETELFLESLTKGHGFLGLKKEAVEVREAARQAREEIAAQGGREEP